MDQQLKFNAIAFFIIISCFFVAGMVKAHDAVVVDVQKTDAALRYACTAFVDQIEPAVPDAEKAITTCVNTLAERFGAEYYQHDHS